MRVLRESSRRDPPPRVERSPSASTSPGEEASPPMPDLPCTCRRRPRGLRNHAGQRRADPSAHRGLGRSRASGSYRHGRRGSCRGHRDARRAAALPGRARGRRLPDGLAGLLRVAGSRGGLRHRGAGGHRGPGRRLRPRPRAMRHGGRTHRSPRAAAAAHPRVAQGGGPLGGRARAPLLPRPQQPRRRRRDPCRARPLVRQDRGEGSGRRDAAHRGRHRLLRARRPAPVRGARAGARRVPTGSGMGAGNRDLGRSRHARTDPRRHRRRLGPEPHDGRGGRRHDR
ncbi:hypothetical protein FHX79_11287 [Streptomyces cavourensis]|nr:hypothetical protein FHX79_11287 [Streptomyces cavourensis]